MSEVGIGDSASSSSRPERIGPYRILSRLGSGGMGAVYRAHDERLGRDVALKQLLPEIADDSHARGRFLREARAVARLNHPNIVQIHDVVEVDGRDWIVLELAEGRTLAESMAGGKLPLVQALGLANELAKGLAVAHAKGIVHRDLKAKNVIVNDEGQIKILDFGLAKQLKLREGDASLSATRGLMGTPQAMSPEQVLHKTVDHRSDLFSLGSLLYEMVTGTSPFLDATPVRTMKKIYDHPHTPACELDPEVPAEVSALIDQLLEKDPDDRPLSAEHVSLVLEDLLIPFEGSTASVSSWPSPSRVVSRPWWAKALDTFGRDPAVRYRWAVGLAMLVIVAGVVAWLRWSEPKRREASQNPVAARSVGERPRIVVGRFDNQTGEAALDQALKLAFQVGLEQSRHALVLPDSQIREVLRRMHRDPETTVVDRDIGVEICKREGAKALVTGSIVEIGGSYRINVSIIDPKTEISSFSMGTIAERQDDIIAALDELTREMRIHLGESLASIDSTVRLEKVTTGDLEALKAYSAGVRISISVEKIFGEARQLFQRAIDKDPDFAMAHAKLARIYLDVDRNYTKALRHLDRALELSDRLTGFEELYVKGWLARLRGSPQDVVDVWLSMSSLYPDDVTGYRNAGMAYIFLFNRFDKAAASLQRALEVDGGGEYRVSIAGNLGYSRLAVGQTDAALRIFENHDASWDAMTFYHIVVEDYQRARALLDVQRPTLTTKTSLEESKLRMLFSASLGDFDQAIAAAKAGRQIARELGSDWNDLAGSLVVAALMERWGSEGQLRESLAQGFTIIDEILQTELDPVEFQPGVTLAGVHGLPIQVFVLVGKLSARNSIVGEAEWLHHRLQQVAERRGLPIWMALVYMLEAEILAERGDFSAALTRLDVAQTYADSFQIHESLARIHRLAGDTAAAISEYEWLIANRGLALVECFDGCAAASVLDFNLAFYQLARLHDDAGEEQEALRYYQQFLDRWPEADDFPEWQSAQQRLIELQATRNE